ncbi:putative Ferric reductase transmembrane component [Rhodotorula toruloides ATCC 204091]|uniref:Putative ferric reductase transmembrane component n=1 Tax=Rhodotorula toruloides TaxID=5286 RepID=A0A0K3CJY6_RHOTO|nr:putative Ferric reductase transmembrane component [Rhodotorula toruloides ATCC 204091]PRQ74470.1 putative ferric reductase transmembrane component [Rhodotorula toruloides]
MSVCYGPAGIPEPCTGWQIYDSYTTDPLYQRRFTIAWTCTFALAFLLVAPSIVRVVATNEWYWSLGGCVGLFGVHEGSQGGYEQLEGEGGSTSRQVNLRLPRSVRRFTLAISSLVSSASRFTIPLPTLFNRFPAIPGTGSSYTPSCYPTRPYLPFSLGKLFGVLLIPAFILATLLPESQLRENPNRFGFLAVACLPPLFVLSAKNGPVKSLLGRGWTAVNFLHRWIGRMIVLLVLLHFYFWTIQYSGADRTEFLAGEKQRRGIAALAFLLLITVSSLPPMRRFSYPIFFTLHYVGLIGFLVFLNKHTVYAYPWASWVIAAIYVADLAGRMASMRIRFVEVEALHGGMVKLSMLGLRGGWRGGQHLSIRLFFAPPSLHHGPTVSRLARIWQDTTHAIRSSVRPFEAHPFSISTAPPHLAANPLAAASTDRGIELYARSCGKRTWTDDLFHFAVSSRSTSTDSARRTPIYLPCLIEGPYGGLPTYSSPALLEDTESVLLVAGGSGMTFVLGVLDELVGRRLRAKKGGRVDVVWVVRQRAHLAWFAERLGEICDAAKEGKTGLRVVLKSTAPSRPAATVSPSVGAENSLPRGRKEPVLATADADEILELPSLVVSAANQPTSSPSCCAPSSSRPSQPPTSSCGGCCSRTTGGGCCTGTREGAKDADEDEKDRVAGRPLRIRTGGLGVVVCGPGHMVAELRNAVATIPLAKQVRIGGVGMHVEQYSV